MSERGPGPYQFFMLGLCFYVLAALSAQTLFTLDAQTLRILDLADFAVSLIFLADFVYLLATAEDRKRYLLTWGWLDLISSIPLLDFCRWGRAARVFRILRVLRAVRATRFLTVFVLEKRTQCAFWAAALIAILLVIFGSIGVLHLETPAEANIVTAEGALWWAVVTLTTVGYGDHYPVSGAGRLLAVCLMLAGIGLFGTFTAVVASAFLAPGEEEQGRELTEIRRELESIRRLLPQSMKNSGNETERT